MAVAFWIANSASDLIQGDVREHLPLEYPDTTLEQLERLVLYPLEHIHTLASDLGGDRLRYVGKAAHSGISNRAALELTL